MDERELRAGRLVGVDVDELDITDRSAIRSAVADLKPALVVNAAAYTDVDGCESNVEQAMAVNGRAPGFIAEACSATGALLVHYSTDFVFDGSAQRPYQPDDMAKPLSAYGQSKWAGEEAVRQSGCRQLIVRTSWLFGPAGRNFVEAILARAKSGEPLRVVTDQVGRPTLAADLAAGLKGRSVIVYAANGLTGPAALRWKTQINENAKWPAWVGLFPEVDHNEIVSWTSLSELSRDHFGIVTLRDESESARLGARFDHTARLTSGTVPWVGEVWSQGVSALEQMMSLCAMGDLVSIEIARAAGVDPVPVETIEKLKALLAEESG